MRALIMAVALVAGLLVAAPAPPQVAVDVVRLSGGDRAQTAAAIASASFPDGARRVFLATGDRFADALTGGPATGGEGPILLTAAGGLPPATARALEALDPVELVVLGGRAAISEPLAAEAAAVAGAPVVRLGGADRFQTAVSISRWAFPDGAARAFVATGAEFADALSGGVAAALTDGGAPVLLVDGGRVPPETLEELRRLSPDGITVLGGTSAVPDAVEAVLTEVAPVTRLAGADRLATAAEVSRATFAEADTVYVARGGAFADALAGAPAAILDLGPLLLVPDAGTATFAQAPGPAAEEVARLQPGRIIVLGGPSAVSEETVVQLVDQASQGGTVTPAETPTEEDADTPGDAPGDTTGSGSGEGGGTTGGGPDGGSAPPPPAPPAPAPPAPAPPAPAPPPPAPAPPPPAPPPPPADTQPPVFPSPSVLVFTDVGTTTATVTWPAASDDVGVTGYTVLLDGDVDRILGADARDATLTGLAPGTTTTVSVTAADAAGNVSDPLSGQLTTATAPPPDAIAPPVRPAPAMTTAAATRFLFAGPNPLQTLPDGAPIDPDAIDEQRAAALSGRVVDVDGEGLPGVVVALLGLPELGQTTTRDDGRWDLAVNGGGRVTVTFTGDGLLPAQRAVDVGWQGWLAVDDVVLIPLDPTQTTIDLPAIGDQQHAVARGSVVTDDAGSRQGTLLFPQGTTAALRFSSGPSQPVDQLTVRITEYTVGPDGPARMPAGLPPTSGYTYAFELTADEAVAAGADGVDFPGTRPLFYAENFVGAPVGAVVPFASYDADAGVWIPKPDGRVIEILSIAGGAAEVDSTGDGVADDGAALQPPMTTAERRTLATLYTAGAQLQRVPTDSFSPKDPNFPTTDPDDIVDPEPVEPTPGDPDSGVDPPEESRPGDETEDFGSISAVDQTFTERIPVVGTPLVLTHHSEAVAARRLAVTVGVLGRANAPASLQRIEVTLDVAGQRLVQRFLPDELDDGTRTEVELTWDGRDVFGRQLFGAQPAVLRVAYHYPLIYLAPLEGPQPSFGLYPNPAGPGFLRTSAGGEIVTRASTVERPFTLNAGRVRADAGLGGWSLQLHHAYDPTGEVLVRGDGRVRSASIGRVATTLFGHDMACDQGLFTDVGTCRDVGAVPDPALEEIQDLDVRADGSVLLVQQDLEDQVDPAHVLGVDSDGAAVEVLVPAAACPAQGGLSGACDATAIADVGDGTFWVGYQRGRAIRYDDTGTVLEAVLADPDTLPVVDLAFSDDLGLVVASVGGIFQVPPGSATSVRLAGDGNGCPDVDDCIAADLHFGQSDLLALAVDEAEGLIYFVEQDLGNASFAQVSIGGSTLLWRIDPDGRAHVVAGGGFEDPANGVLAREAAFFSIEDLVVLEDRTPVLHADGTLFELRGGRLFAIAGRQDDDCPPATCGEGAAAGQLLLESTGGLAVSPDGSLLVGDPDDDSVRRLSSPYPGFDGGDLVVPSADGLDVFEFDAAGRHLATRDSTTGGDLVRFGYDDDGRLRTVTFVNGQADEDLADQGTDPLDNTVTITRDADGAPTAIVGPFGDTTTLAVDADGWLSALTNPAGETVALEHTADGLLTAVTGARDGTTYTIAYDPQGRVVAATDPLAHTTTWARTVEDGVATVRVTSPTGLVTRHETFVDPDDGTLVQRRTSPDGSVTESRTTPSGVVRVQSPSGVVTLSQSGPDPRFGMLAPYATRTETRMPSGLTRVLTSSRALDDPDSPTTLTLTDRLNDGPPAMTTISLVGGSVTATSPSGVTATSTVDPQGRPLTVQVEAVPSVRNTFDRGRLSAVQQSDREVTFSYLDGDGEDTAVLHEVTDPLRQTALTTTDPAGRPTVVTNPEGETTALDYDQNGLVVGLTPPGRTTHAQMRDLRGEVIAYIPPGPGGEPPADDAVAHTIDAEGRVVRTERPDGTDLAAAFDPTSGLPLSTEVGGFGVTTYGYDAVSRLLVTMAGPDGIDLADEHDGTLPTRTTVTLPSGAEATIARTFDEAFRGASVAVNGGPPVIRTYDGDGNLVAIGLATIARDALLRPQQVTVGDVTTAFTFDELGALASITSVAAGTEVFRQVITRDAGGRVAELIESVAGGPEQATAYAYDGAGRLTSVSEDRGADGTVEETRDYAYDANGNRISGPEGVHTYDGRDRITDPGYAFDAAGDLTEHPGGTADYDANGGLQQATVGATTISYGVDPIGRRVLRDDGTQQTAYLYDGSLNPIAEIDPTTGDTVATYVYGLSDSVPEYLERGGVTGVVVRDHAGNPRLVVDADGGAILQHLDYDEFGIPSLRSGDGGLHPFRFRGGLADEATGWVRFGARDYDPALGRFTTRDPILFGGGQTNLYTFAGSDPINRSDPTGLGPGGGGGGGGDDCAGGRRLSDIPQGPPVPDPEPPSVLPSDMSDPSAIYEEIHPVVGRVVKTSEGGTLTDPRSGQPYHLEDRVRIGDQLATDQTTFAAIEFYTGGQIGINKSTTIEVTAEDNAQVVGPGPSVWDRINPYDDPQPVQIRNSSGVMGISDWKPRYYTDEECAQRVRALEQWRARFEG